MASELMLASTEADDRPHPPVRIAHVATVDLTVRFLLLPQLVGLREAGLDVTAVSAPGPWVSEVEEMGIRHIPWPSATRAWDLMADLRALSELVAILRRERFDLVHTHNAKPGVMGRIAARMLGVPCVVNTVHGFDAPPGAPLAKRVTYMGAEWIAARFSQLELYQGRQDLDRAQRLHMLRPGQGVFLGNGTDISRFDPSAVDPSRLARLREDLGLSPDALVVGIVGRLVAEKGYRELFAAARVVRAAIPTVRFLAVGDPDPMKADSIGREEIERASAAVVFAGWRRDVPDLLRLMDVFALPSWREGVPRSAIEAAAMGRPLVLSDIPGCRQVVKHGIEGFLVRSRDAAGLASAILKLLQDPDLRARMGSAARARAVREFDERRMVATILERYRGLVEPASGIR